MQSLADSFDPTVMVTHRDLKWLELKMQPILMEAEALECKFQRLEEQCQKQQPEMVTGLKKESPKSHTSGAVSHAPEVPKPVVRPSVISYEPLLTPTYLTPTPVSTTSSVPVPPSAITSSSSIMQVREDWRWKEENVHA